MPEESLTKKALLENIKLRTNWILTIEKLLKTFNLIECSNNSNKFQKNSREHVQTYHNTIWKREIINLDSSRLKVYKIINKDFTTPDYLTLTLDMRRMIAKMRCSDHKLEIERGRHLRKDVKDRICKTCTGGNIEDEDHFLIKCKTYQHIRGKHQMFADNIYSFLNCKDQINLAKYIQEAFELRENLITGQQRHLSQPSEYEQGEPGWET